MEIHKYMHIFKIYFSKILYNSARNSTALVVGIDLCYNTPDNFENISPTLWEVSNCQNYRNILQFFRFCDNRPNVILLATTSVDRLSSFRPTFHFLRRRRFFFTPSPSYGLR